MQLRVSKKAVALFTLLSVASCACGAETLILRATGVLTPGPHELRVIRKYPEVNEYVVAVPKNQSAVDYAKSLRASGLYESVSLNPVVRPCRRPDDAKYPFQWHHQLMQSERAWEIRSGLGSDVVVGLVDTGVDLSHPDLVPNLVLGWDMISNRSQADGGDVQDDDGHGTAMAGLIAARGNNGQGVVGMGWGIKVMPIKVLDGATLDQVLAGARKAADLGCKVINVSYQGVEQQAVETTGQYCKSLGALLVYAAGNNGQNLAFDYSDVIIVGASNEQDQLMPGSAYGTAIDVVAPGSNLLSTGRHGTYQYVGGTSASAAITSGVAALMRWINPYMTWETWSNNLVRGTVDIGPMGDDSIFGWGRLSNYLATKRVVPLVAELVPQSLTLDQEIWHINNEGTLFGRTYLISNNIRTDVTTAHLYAAYGGFQGITCVDNNGVAYGYCQKNVNNAFIDTPVVLRPPAYFAEVLPMPTVGAKQGFTPEHCNDSGSVVGTLEIWDSGPRIARPARLESGHLTILYDQDLTPRSINRFGDITLCDGNAGILIPHNGFATPISVLGTSRIGNLVVDDELSLAATALSTNANNWGLFVNPYGTWVPTVDIAENGSGSPAVATSAIFNSFGQVWSWGRFNSKNATFLFNDARAEDLFNLLALPTQLNRESVPRDANDFGVTVVSQVGGGTYVVRPLYNQGQSGLTVNCGVVFGDYLGDLFEVPITIRLYQNGVLKETIPNIVPGSNGYKFYTLQSGSFRATITAPHFLTFAVQDLVIGFGQGSAFQATLINGDCSGDNYIGTDDYLILNGAYDLFKGDGGFDLRADLDGDGYIGTDDYLVLNKNFDLHGD